MKYAEYYKLPDKAEFLNKVVTVASMLGLQPDDLMTMFYLESTVNPAAQNKYTRATGLIQFIPSTAADLGTTVEELKQMNGTEQLDYVYKYLKIWRNKVRDYHDLYIAIFYPAALGKGDDYVIGTADNRVAKIAQQNAAYDLNKDGKITVAELKTAIDLRILKKKRKTQHLTEQPSSSPEQPL